MSVLISCSAASSWISRKATFAFCLAKAPTIASPIPLAPPVTITTRSRRLGYVANFLISSTQYFLSALRQPIHYVARTERGFENRIRRRFYTYAEQEKLLIPPFE